MHGYDGLLGLGTKHLVAAQAIVVGLLVFHDDGDLLSDKHLGKGGIEIKFDNFVAAE